MSWTIIRISCAIALVFLACQTKIINNEITGRWDVTIEGIDGNYPSWFEIKSDSGRLSGQFVGRVGSARPITNLSFKDDLLNFSLPPQWEKQKEDLVFEGRLRQRRFTGETTDTLKNIIKWSAVKAPELPYSDDIIWGEPQDLIKDDLSNWELRYPDKSNGWVIEDGILSNTPPSEDLYSKEKYRDFKLHIEFRIPEKANSGVYLRGRYEIQIMDDSEREPSVHTTGAVYGFYTPEKKVANPHGEWNTYDITLVGRWITVELNGHKIVDHKEIPGITGGALDANEGEPGPLMLQGDHRAVEYRNIVITPATS
jgi:hypothetical protein